MQALHLLQPFSSTSGSFLTLPSASSILTHTYLHPTTHAAQPLQASILSLNCICCLLSKHRRPARRAASPAILFIKTTAFRAKGSAIIILYYIPRKLARVRRPKEYKKDRRTGRSCSACTRGPHLFFLRLRAIPPQTIISVLPVRPEDLSYS